MVTGFSCLDGMTVGAVANRTKQNMMKRVRKQHILRHDLQQQDVRRQQLLLRLVMRSIFRYLHLTNVEGFATTVEEEKTIACSRQLSLQQHLLRQMYQRSI